MVTKVSPTRYLYNSTHNLYAVLVQRTATSYYYVSANAQASILPPPYSHRYGQEWSTLQQAIDNIPAGFQIITAPESCNLSIQSAVTIFGSIYLSVYGSPAEATSWTLQISSDGTTWSEATTVTELLQNGSSGIQGNADAEGEITYEVFASGNYFFRVLSGGCISNVIARSLTIFGDTGGGGGETTNAFTTVTLASDFDIDTQGFPYVSFHDSSGVAGKDRAAMQNVVALQGFDYMTIKGRYETLTSPQGITRPVLVQWTQKTVNTASSLNNLIQEGPQTYYFRPPGYIPDYSYNMYDFHLKFPNFTAPQGKLISIQPVPFSDSEQALMIQKGATHVRRGVPDANRVYFFGDAWLSFINDVNNQLLPLPPAYTPPESERQNFYEMLNPYQMAAHLRDTLAANGIAGYGYIFWNYERVLDWDDRIGTWGIVQPRAEDVGKPKRQIFFEEFARLKVQTLLFIPWTKKPIILDPSWLNQNTKAAWDAVYSGTATTYAQLDQVYVSNNLVPRTFPNGVSSVVSMDGYHVGFYQIGHIKYLEFLYKHIMEAYMNKRMAAPGKKVIGTLWMDFETLPDNDVWSQVVAVSRYNETLNIAMKPVASYFYMQSYAAWLTALADGFDIWEYREFKEDKATWDRLKDPNLEFQAPQFPYNSMKGIDWAMSAVWALKQNDDILTAATGWVFPIDPWTAAGGLSGAGSKAPLVAYKLNNQGTVALVLALDIYNEDMGLKEVSVIINGVARMVKIHHKFTSIVRITL